MKQHITTSQLYGFIENDNSMLLDKRLSVIIKLVGKHSGISTAEKMTIGKMIEILELKTGATQQIINTHGKYCVSMNIKQGNTDKYSTEYCNELCDALWKAVEYVLS